MCGLSPTPRYTLSGEFDKFTGNKGCWQVPRARNFCTTAEKLAPVRLEVVRSFVRIPAWNSGTSSCICIGRPLVTLASASCLWERLKICLERRWRCFVAAGWMSARMGRDYSEDIVFRVGKCLEKYPEYFLSSANKCIKLWRQNTQINYKINVLNVETISIN